MVAGRPNRQQGTGRIRNRGDMGSGGRKHRASHRAIRGAVTLALAGLLAGCAAVSPLASSREGQIPAIENVLAGHIEALSSDAMQGRYPGTASDLATQDYIETALASYGYEPGYMGEWRQPVSIAAPLVLRKQDGDVETAAKQPSPIESANVIGVLRGSRPGNGVVLLLAHFDHLGECTAPHGIEPAPGSENAGESIRLAANDRICNGAVDNASGVAVMLETARRIAAAGPLDRDLYVIGLTGEEEGLFGAEDFADDPPFPLPTVVAAFNLDTMAVAPAGAPVAVIGWGYTPLDKGIGKVVQAQGRKLLNRPEQERWLRRQDGWALLRRDVPAVLVSSTFADEDRLGAFIASGYHSPADEWGPHVELGGAADDVLLHVALLRHFGDVEQYHVGRD